MRESPAPVARGLGVLPPSRLVMGRAGPVGDVFWRKAQAGRRRSSRGFPPRPPRAPAGTTG